MPETRRNADVFEYMNAYAVLDVPYTASTIEIRRAYRSAAQRAHPDRYPSNSPEQQRATERMAAINEAYRLVREAPLRHHRVSRQADPDVVWSESELDDALRRARNQRVTMDVAQAVVCGVVGILIAAALVDRFVRVDVPGFYLLGYMLPGLVGVGAAVLGTRFLSIWYVIDFLLVLSRVISFR